MSGELRIYLGAAPGVGKTFAALAEARRRAERGGRVLVLSAATHERPKTEALLEGLEVVPDVDELLARRPQVVVADDLAARVTDVERLLDADMDVISTLDVSELESLRDVVRKITGVEPEHTVPDAFVARAAQVELVDMTPEALRRRLAHGNVLPAESFDIATAGRFRVERLAALRELALRWVADRTPTRWETGERVVVALTGAPGADVVVRRAARIASRSHASLVGIHVRAGDPPPDLLHHRTLLEELGGAYREVAGADVATALVDAARGEGATQLVLGASRRTRARASVVTRVARLATDVDVHVVAGGTGAGLDRRPVLFGVPRRRALLAWAVAAVLLPILTVVLRALEDQVHLPSVLLLYLLAVVVVAAVGGIGPAVGAAVGAFLLANWWFTPPLHRLEIDAAEDAVALTAFLVVAAVVSGLVALAERRAADAERARGDAEALIRLSATAAADVRVPALLATVREVFALDGVAILHNDAVLHLVGTIDQPSMRLPLDDGDELVLGGEPLPAQERSVLQAFADQLQAARRAERLREAASGNELRTALLSAVSHDLRTPLASIKASVSSLLQDDVDWTPADVRDFLETIDEETDRLNGLVGNLLDMSRIATGTIRVSPRGVGLDEVVPAAMAGLGDRAGRVQVDVPESLPRAWADPGLLERAIANVVGNALDWSPERAVRVEAGRAGDALELRVIDRGPGVPPSERARMFEPFQRLGDAPGTQGVGLGLAVARGFVSAMGGDLEVEDTPGGGLTMVLTLPEAAR